MGITSRDNHIDHHRGVVRSTRGKEQMRKREQKHTLLQNYLRWFNNYPTWIVYRFGPK